MKLKFTPLLLLFIFILTNSHGQTPAGNSFYIDYPSWNAGTQPPVYFNCGTNNILNTGNELTMEVWVRMYNSTWNQKIMGKVTPAFDNGYVMGMQLGQNYSEIWNPALNTIQAGSTPVDSAWVHFATTFGSGGQMLCYVNGEQVGGLPLTGNAIASSSNPFIIGIAPWDLTNFQSFGQIDEVRLWSVVRTQDDIKSTMHKQLQGNEPGLVAYYDFNQSAGGNLPDISGNGNNGTISPTAAYWSWSPSYAAVGDGPLYAMLDVAAVWFGKDATLYNYATTTNGLNIIANIQPKAFDYAVYGHNDSSGISTSFLPATAPIDFERTSREWYFKKGGNIGADLYFNLSTAAAGGDSLEKNLAVQNYTLLSRDSTNQLFTPVAAASTLLAGGTVVKFTGINLENKYYCIGVGSTAIAAVPATPEWSKLISLLPNPAQHSITITNIAGAELQVLDAVGKQVMQWKGIELQQYFDVSTLENGSYFLKITKDRESTTKQFIIQK
ncbi:MAG: T9SS type A sorting domain-containing protein [Bacteroidetes bacterium]|nr:T9SS type A sorting domain-containing protein [Bacteroidota bacterium]